MFATDEKTCRHRTLARNGRIHIQECVECGTLTMHLGGLSLRFDPETLEGLWNTVGEALVELHEHKLRESGFAGGADVRFPLGNA